MTPREYALAAIDMVIDLAAEQKLKYRRGDFRIVGEPHKKGIDNLVDYIGGENDPKGD